MKPDASRRILSTVARMNPCRTAVCALAIALPIVLAPSTPQAQDRAMPVETQRLMLNSVVTTDTYFGTVRASSISSLSYAARGCIVEVSEPAKNDRVVEAGQILVKLDDQRPQLALRTAEARVADLVATVAERQLALDFARADDRRRKQEFEFVSKEFQRNSTMLGRGLINETAMDAVERRLMDAEFAADRAKEAIANAEAAVNRAEIAVEIGKLELQTAALNQADVLLTAPFGGVLVGFEANVGDCVQEGGLAARIYEPDQKSVDVYFQIDRLSAPDASGLAIGAAVKVVRVNGKQCDGTITRIDTEADPETQYVEATVDVARACAPSLFLNESVKIEAVQSAVENAYSVPNSAVRGNNTVFLVDEDTRRLVAVEAEVILRGENETIVRIPDANGRLVVKVSDSSLTDGLTVDPQEPG